MRSATLKLRMKAAVHREIGQKAKDDALLGAPPGSLMEAAEKVKAKDVRNRTEVAKKVEAKAWRNHSTQECKIARFPSRRNLKLMCTAYINAIHHTLRNVDTETYFRREIEAHQDIQGCTFERAREECEKDHCQIDKTFPACDLFQKVANGEVWERELKTVSQALQSHPAKKYMACTLDSIWRKCEIKNKPEEGQRPCAVTPLCTEAEKYFKMKRGWKGMTEWISDKHEYQECQNQKPRVIKRECQGSEKGCFVNLAQVSVEYKLEFCSEWNTAPDKESFLDKMWKDSNTACYANDIDEYCSQV